MKCPYCLSEISDEALSCPHCTKDLYLFKPMMKRVADIEAQLGELPERRILLERVAQLEGMLVDQAMGQSQSSKGSVGREAKSIVFFLVLPLLILLVGHGLITIVYDTKLIYLRVLSIIVPALFGYALMVGRSHKLLPWLFLASALAISSVFGMSYMTHLVDGSPVMPQNVFEWREFFEYGVSITASFFTGMILGRASYIKHHPMMKTVISGAYSAVMANAGKDGSDPAGAFRLMKLLNEHISIVTALGSTALSIYTGLKSILN